MRLDEIGEFGLIERIRRTVSPSKRAPIGIGDDAAALSFSPNQLVLATTDMLVEGVHFDLATTDLVSLGWKSAAVNLSDIAAMGGVPRFLLVGLAIPRGMRLDQIDDLYRGFRSLAGSYGALLVGGDTCSSRRGLVISVTALGESPRARMVARSGARPGDLVFVTGTLGDSGAGFELLQKNVRRKGSGGARGGSKAEMLIERHLRPVPRVEWGRKLAASGAVTSMIDVSDGLSSDLHHLCNESNCGAEVLAEQVPLSPALCSATGLKRQPLDYALSGGEDYELLFTAPSTGRERIRRLGITATVIGTIEKKKGMRLRLSSGRVIRLEPSGYDHFRSAGKGGAR